MKHLFISFFFWMFYVPATAQKVHLTTFIGASNYQGDLKAKTLTFNQASLADGLGLSYEISDKIFIRSGVIIAKVTADDKLNSKNFARNLNFTSLITEGFIGVEYYFRNLNEYPLSPYILGGIAVYHFDPYTRDTAGTKYFLKPLTTEGQGFYLNRKPYNLTQFAIPFGGGIKLALNENVRVGIEIGLRKLFTDYLDDVSTTYVDRNQLLANSGAKAVELAFRGNELKNGSTYPVAGSKRGGNKFKDWYYFTGLALSFKIGGSNNKSWGGRKRKSQTGCPPKVS